MKLLFYYGSMGFLGDFCKVPINCLLLVLEVITSMFFKQLSKMYSIRSKTQTDPLSNDLQ